MKITFVSNFLNHHQLPFCLEMYNNPNIDFTFIATTPVPNERIQLGYEDMNSKYSFVIEAYKDEKENKKALNISNESDIVIIGSAPEQYIEKRLIENKITFRYYERIFRKGIWRIVRPRTMKYLLSNHTKYRKKNLYMLCASAYTAYDFSLVNAYKGKCYKWGYFPEAKKYNIKELIKSKRANEPIRLLWVARFIKLKHPELPIELAKLLIKKNYNFKIQMVGNGELFDIIKEKIKQENLTNYIELVGAVPASEVRKYMEEANVFLATFDKREGWGAVVNEAMNSACVVVGNKRIGSIPYLIKNQENGLIYKNKKEFFNKVEYLINNQKEIEKMAINAYNTIVNTWNAKKATENLILLSNALLNNSEISIKEGPCSKDNEGSSKWKK